MPIEVTLKNGEVRYFPDGTPYEEIRRQIERLEAEDLAEKETDLFGAVERGFKRSVGSPFRTIGGAAALVDKIIPGEQEPLEDIADWGRGIGERADRWAGPERSDTIPEKIAEGLGAAPVTLLELLPFGVGIPKILAKAGLGAVPGLAAGFGLHGALARGDESWQDIGAGAGRGALEGAAFGAVGKAAGTIIDPGALLSAGMKRRLAHSAGAAGIGFGGAAISGEPLEDAVAAGATLGILGALQEPKPYRPLTTKDVETYGMVGKIRELYDKSLREPYEPSGKFTMGEMRVGRGANKAREFNIKDLDLDDLPPAYSKTVRNFIRNKESTHEATANKWGDAELIPVEELLRFVDLPQTGVVEAKGSLRRHMDTNGIVEPLVFTYNPNIGRGYLERGTNRVLAALENNVDHVPVRVVRNYDITHKGTTGEVAPPTGRQPKHTGESPRMSDLGFSPTPDRINAVIGSAKSKMMRSPERRKYQWSRVDRAMKRARTPLETRTTGDRINELGPNTALSEIHPELLEKLQKEGKLTAEQIKARADSLSKEDLDRVVKATKGRLSAAVYLQGEWARDAHKVMLEHKKALDKLKAENAPQETIDLAQEAYDLWLNKEFAAIGDVYGFRGEIGRAMRTMQIQTRNEPPGHVMLGRAAKRRTILPRDIIERLIENPHDLKAVIEAGKVLDPPSLADKAYEVWINGLLSSPPTHIVNSTSNMATQALDMVEKAAAPGFDFLRVAAGKLMGKEVARERFFSEMYAERIGWFQGLQEAWGHLRGVWRDEDYRLLENQKLENIHRNIGGRAGVAIRTPGRFLQGVDMAFKAIGSQREGWRWAYRKARTEGLRGQSMHNRARAIMANSNKYPALLDAQKLASETLTFTNDPHDWINVVTHLRSSLPGMRWVLPFVRTPGNIVEFALKRSPLRLGASVAGKGTAGEWKKYKRGEITGGELSEELSRVMVSSLGTWMLLSMAEGGLITGSGPEDFAEKYNKMKTGWMPHSLKVGDKYVSYARVEPLATLLGMAADALDIRHAANGEEAVHKLIQAVKGNVSDKTFLIGMENLAKAWASPERFGPAYAKTLLGSAVPAGLGAVNNMLDPYVRATDLGETVYGVPEVMAARIPGLSTGLPVRHDIHGDEVLKAGVRSEQVTGGGPIMAAANPIYWSQEHPEELVAIEMDRLSKFPGVPPSMPGRSKNITLSGPFGESVKLTDQEYDVYSQYHRMAEQVLMQMISDPAWFNYTDEVKADLIRKVYSKFSRSANKQINGMIMGRVGGMGG